MPVNSFDNYPMSWKPQIEHGAAPIYLAIAEQLEKDIRSGVLAPGTKLPPQRELADFLDVNLSTVSRAFKNCEQKGLICASSAAAPLCRPMWQSIRFCCSRMTPTG